jgi:hypothetical protein
MKENLSKENPNEVLSNPNYSRAKIIGQILQKYPNIQSTSPELYFLAYVKRFGADKI